MSDQLLNKTYSPRDIESRIYNEWEENGFFKVGRSPNGEPYTIVIPPPNVTGRLHMGHALNNTLQDILCRFERMRGRDVLWQPGTDHAGIATQMIVERQLEADGKSRLEMGRETFLEHVWQWKEESGSTITHQLRRLGASCDWSRERFTMDKGLSIAVNKVFVRLYEKGLIYKDKRLVNWDPVLLTAISDLEVIQEEVQGHLWHFNYPLEDGCGYITVATTRPETILGDTAVVVHPSDERYKNMVGKNVILPIVGRIIPIIADDYVDPEQGSGAVKVTPAHDMNDFEVGHRHGLEMINILNEKAELSFDYSQFVNEKGAFPDDLLSWEGMDRFDARKRVEETMKNLSLLKNIEDYHHVVPYGDRSGVVIEPRLTDQWYVKAKELAQPAIEAVKNGDTKFVPAHWDKTYFKWMDNIQPWCISRQLWWGHQIPAWYDGVENKVWVAHTQEEAFQQAKDYYQKTLEPTFLNNVEKEGWFSFLSLCRDEDVLDTWFSSALWPFSTLDWPDNTDILKRHYKTDVLITGFDIIFFWVARMMMMGLEFQQEVPFHTVYIHALVRDEQGQKMSKSKGNVVDPLALIDQYGADALRFTLTAMAVMGRDIKLSESRIEGYRNFGTKLWNFARFAEINGCFVERFFDLKKIDNPLNRWIIGEVIRTEKALRKSLEFYRFHDAASIIYQFIWNNVCDWYIELAKPVLQSTNDESLKYETQATIKWVLDQALILLHPFMPFVTEELWQKIQKRETALIISSWVAISEEYVDMQADTDIEWLIRVITEIRSVRSEMNVPASVQMTLLVSGASENTHRRLDIYEMTLKHLARLENIEEREPIPKAVIQIVLDEAMFYLVLEDVVNFEAEIIRLNKDLHQLDSQITKISDKLNNESFMCKAPVRIIEENRKRLSGEQSKREKLVCALERLSHYK